MQKETAQNTNKGIPSGKQAKRDIKHFHPESQCGEILAILQSGGSLTAYEAAKMGIVGFHPRLNDLRRAGYPVVCTMQEHINKHGRTVKRGVFSLVHGKGAEQ